MSRTTIVLLLALVVGATAGGTYRLVFPRVAELRLEEARQGLQVAARLMQELDRVDEARLRESLEGLAARPSLRALLRERPGEASAREDWLGRLRTEVAGLEAELREVAAAREFMLLEPGGAGLVKHGEAGWAGGPPAPDGPHGQAVREAASGRSVACLAPIGEGLERVVAAPVRDGERVRGLLLATFALDDGLLRARGGEAPLAAGFAYLTARGVVAADLPAAQRRALAAHLQATPEIVTRLLAGKPVEPFRIDALLVLGAPVTARGGPGQAGLLAVRSVRKLNRPLDELAVYLFSAAGLGLLGLAFLTVLLGGRLPRGLRQVEVQTGELTAVVATGGQVGRLRPVGPRPVRRLVSALNALLEATCRVRPSSAPQAGRAAREPTGTDMDVSMLNLEEPIEGPAAGRAGGAEDVRQEAYFRRLYDEFRVARAQAGEPVDGKLDFERFRRKLERQAELLVARHACHAVRFEVVSRDGEVSLRPTLER